MRNTVTQLPRFRFVNVVWGAEFTKAFLDVCLPSQLSPRNLPYFAQHTESQYWIYTTGSYAEIIRRSDSYKALSALMRVEVVVISGISRVGKYQAMNQCQSHFIRSAAHDNSSLSFQSPDIVWADGSFAQLLELFRRGVRNVATGSMRLNKETFLPALLQRYGDGVRLHSITSRQLVKLALEHLHPVTVAQIWGPDSHSSFITGESFWRVGSDGLVLRHFRLQPVMVTPVDRSNVPAVSSDADYTDKVCRDPHDWYIVRDSDEMCYVDFTPAGYGSVYGDLIKPSKPTVAEQAEWVRGHDFRTHRHFVRHPIRFHATDCSQRWEDLERQSEEVITEILALADQKNVLPVATNQALFRYASVRFWSAKVRQTGAQALLKEGVRRTYQALLQLAWGPEIGIEMAER